MLKRNMCLPVSRRTVSNYRGGGMRGVYERKAQEAYGRETLVFGFHAFLMELSPAIWRTSRIQVSLDKIPAAWKMEGM